MQEKVLISGGTGLVGQHLKELLEKAGYQVGILTRGESTEKNGTRYYHWDIQKKVIDENAMPDTAYLINLAGAGVADKRWTDERKEAIMKSRTESTAFLHQLVKANDIPLQAFISASAVGIYGNYAGSELKTEESPKADDFLARVVKEWETEASAFEADKIRTVKLRIGVVLAREDGALPRITQPIKLYAGAPLGSGNQYMSWIHVTDLARMFLWAIENKELNGNFNAVAPRPVTNKRFTKTAAQELGKPLWLPNVPAFVLKAALGEMASVVLGGVNVSSAKAEQHGFNFKFNSLEDALANLL